MVDIRFILNVINYDHNMISGDEAAAPPREIDRPAIADAGNI
jgi:hypothetical protein